MYDKDLFSDFAREVKGVLGDPVEFNKMIEGLHPIYMEEIDRLLFLADVLDYHCE